MASERRQLSSDMGMACACWLWPHLCGLSWRASSRHVNRPGVTRGDTAAERPCYHLCLLALAAPVRPVLAGAAGEL